MTKFKIFHDYGEELERRIRLRTYPLAIKMLETEQDIPEGAERPVRDLGYHVDLCQGFAISRREGKAMAMLCYVLSRSWATDGQKRPSISWKDTTASLGMSKTWQQAETMPAIFLAWKSASTQG